MDARAHSVNTNRELEIGCLNPHHELLSGLIREQKYINPKYFYDEHGSKLFEDITSLPEYYPTRTEIDILRTNAHSITKCTGKNCQLIEPGAGSCEKVTHLLETMRPCAFLPQDISADFLHQTATRLRQKYQWLNVTPLPGDFHDEINLPANLPKSKRVVFYPGSTIGNFEPTQAAAFLSRMRKLIGEEGGIIIGVDLQKDLSVLNAAYNDNQGITAEFNLNILKHVNRLLKTNFEPNNFKHKAFYNEDCHRIEMHLESRIEQKIDCQDQVLRLDKGETIHTENSYKYTLESFSQLAKCAGLKIRQSWLDENQLFSVHYLEPSSF